METTTITFRTTEDVKKKLDNMALEQNRTLSNMIETIVLKWLEEQEKNTQKWVLFMWKMLIYYRLFLWVIIYYVN